jgi:predicted RND superfamily exporter protein
MLDTIERNLFAFRLPLIILFALLTLAAAWSATSLKFDSDLEKQLPTSHPFAKTALDFKDKIAGLNSVQIAVETSGPTIWTPAFLKTLYDVTQEVTYLKGVARESVSSLWTPSTLVYQATENAVEGTELVPQSVQPESLTPADVVTIRSRALTGGYRGRLFSIDSKSAMIHFSMMPEDAETHQKIDLIEAANLIEQKIRSKFEHDGTTIRVIGFTKFIGDIANKAQDILIFFGVAFALNTLALWYFTRSLSLTLFTVLCALTSVVWLFGIVAWFHLPLHPLGLIVPFLIYVMGISHGIQQINRFLAALTHEHTPAEAARKAFRDLILPGFMSIVIILASFGALLLLPIPFIQDLAIIAMIGVGLKFLSNLILLPLAFSYASFSQASVARETRMSEERQRVMAAFSRDARPTTALYVIAVSVVLALIALWSALNVHVGHSRPGAQELKESSRYNVDSAAIAKGYNLDLDSFVIVTVAKEDSCVDYRVMSQIERFGVEMRAVPGVKSVMSLPEVGRFVHSIMQEGNLKWRVLPKATDVLAAITTAVSDSTGLRNNDCSVMPIALYLTDHRDDTLRRVATAAAQFIKDNPMKGVTFRLATGNGGVLAAINDAVRQAQMTAPLLVFGVIAVLLFVAFRDWRVVPCCLIPIIIANLLGLGLLSWLEIGITITTLPVFILASGIGVDYGLYLYQRIETHIAEGQDIEQAFTLSMQEEGMAVVYTALILVIGVGCWAFSGLKFQADMGWLLALLIAANALGATTLMPALAVTLDRLVPRRKA